MLVLRSSLPTAISCRICHTPARSLASGMQRNMNGDDFAAGVGQNHERVKLFSKKSVKFLDKKAAYFLLFQKASTNILLYLIAIGQTVQSSSNAP